MGSLIYAPEAIIRIETAKNSKGKGAVIDVSEDCSNGSVVRLVGGVSTASVTLLNIGRKYDGMFTPMDKVVIYLRRVKSPMLKFSGYLDSTPKWSAVPGSITMLASCTLKRLVNFMWDPDSPAGYALLGRIDPNASSMNDGGTAKKALDVLTEVAGWSPDQVHISSVPHGWYDQVAKLADKLIADSQAERMSSAAGTGSWIGGNNPIGQMSASITGTGPGTGVMPATVGKCSSFGGPHGGAYGNFALTGEPGTAPRDQNYCLPRESLIYTERGPVAIAEVEVGEQIWSVEDDKPRLAPVTNKVSTGIKSLVRVVTRGRTLRCTLEHQVQILSREGTRQTRRSLSTEWVPAGDLHKGDVVVSLSGVDGGIGREPTPEQAYICGRMVADGTRGDYRSDTDGSYGSGRTRWVMCLNEKERPEMVELLHSEGYPVNDNPDICCVGFITTDLHPWLAEVMNHKSPARYVPSWVWTASNSVREAFLEGVIGGDGSLGQRHNTQGTLCLSMSSKRLIQELRVLAHLLGWGTGNISEDTSRSEGSYVSTGSKWRFVLYRDYSWSSVPSSYSRRGLEMATGLVGQTVISVSADGEAECWDLEVDGPASFVAEGVVVHNCAMRWQYVSPEGRTIPGVNIGQAKAWWANRKIMVVNTKNNKTVVVRAADWGPNINTGRVIDLAPGALAALGAHTDDVLHMGFAPSGVSLGLQSSANAGLGSLLKSTAVGASSGAAVAGGGASGITSGWGRSGDLANMVMAHAAGITFQVNRIAKRQFEGFVNELVSTLGYHPKTIGGFRASGGVGGAMNHGYGAAIDIDAPNPVNVYRPGTNPRYSGGAEGRPYALPKPPAIISLARRWGLGWGGEWHRSKDYMHFEVIGAPFSPSYSGSTGGSPAVIQKWKPPIHGPYTITAHFGDGGTHWASGHSGTDFAAPVGTPIYPVGPGVVATVDTYHGDKAAQPYGNSITINHGGNVFTLYGHMVAPSPLAVGTHVDQSVVIGHVGTTGNSTGPHVHVGLSIGANTESARRASGGIEKYVLGGANRSNPPAGTESVTGDFSASSATGTGSSVTDAGKGLFNVFMFQQNSDNYLSNVLTGYRALLNDVPVLDTISQCMSAAMRDYCSAPNGDFIAWFPDYFGHYGQAGKMVVSPLEIDLVDGPPTISQSDVNLKTHQFVSGASLPNANDAANPIQEQSTAGIASVEFPELMKALFNISSAEATSLASDYLSRMGARPNFTPMNNISGGRQEFFFACHLFMQNWSQQYQTEINLTFMPELFPGMLLCIPIYGVQGYVAQTTDSWSLTDGSGFKTSVVCAPWSSLGKESVIDGLPIGAPL